MKKLQTQRVLQTGIMTFVLFFSYGCMSVITTSRIIKEEDIVRGTSRLELRHMGRNISKNLSVFTMSQAIVVEQGADGKKLINVYDFLTAGGSSYKVDPKTFMIIDGKVFPLLIQSVEYDYVNSISKNTEEVATSDSTSVTVVTGYTEHNNKVTRFNYSFSPEIVEKIKIAKEILFRYYSGPNMHTVRMRKAALKKLKKLL